MVFSGRNVIQFALEPRELNIQIWSDYTSHLFAEFVLSKHLDFCMRVIEENKYFFIIVHFTNNLHSVLTIQDYLVKYSSLL